MDDSRNRHNEHLGVNKIGKNIRKSPLHQPSFTNTARQQPQPQVYNINKNDFRNIVQQLTGSPSHHDPLPRPPQNPSKPSSMRLQKIRPPPLAPLTVNRPQMHPIPVRPPPAPIPALPPPGAAAPSSNNFSRPPLGHFGPPSPSMMPPPYPRGDQIWSNTAESPISAYMRYLQHSILDSGPRQNQMHPQNQPLYPNNQAYLPSYGSGLLPKPTGPPPLPSPRMNGPPPLPSPRMNGPPPLPSPRMNGPPPLPSPRMNGPPPLPSPRMNGLPPLPSPRMSGHPPLLPSPNSEFLLPSPYGFMNMLSPRSPYPLLSPGYQLPSPLTPNFSFSPIHQSGIFGPGPHPPLSPGYGFPLSPSGFFPMSSPRWRDQILSPRWNNH